MTVHLDLSPDTVPDWLAKVAAGDSEDLWDQLDEAERKRRAASVQLDALAEELINRNLASPETARELATVLYEQLSDDEFRELRKDAIESDRDEDYVDKVATELADNIEELSATAESAPVVAFSDAAQYVSYAASAQSQFPTALFGALGAARASSEAALLPIVEFSNEPERLTADYSPRLRVEDPSSHTQG